MTRLFQLVFCVCLLSAIPAFAELPQQVEDDFAVLSGTVIMPVNDEFIIDLDDRDNLHEGDILTLVEPGRTIFHPETKEILGRLDIPVGFLRVTRIQSAYSYAKAISAGLSPAAGAKVKRFEQVPARFAASDDGAGAVASQIMMDLPQFRWLSAEQTEQELLTFMLKGELLEVKTAQGNYLHQYKIAENQQLVATAAPVRRPFVSAKAKPEPKLLEQLSQGILSMVNLADEEHLPGRDITMIRQGAGRQQGVWLGPNINGHPVGIAVADLDGDGRQETVVALENKLQISRIIDGQHNLVAELDIPRLLQPLSLDVIDLDKNGRPELVVTAVSGFRPSSVVIESVGDNYAIVIDKIRWLLRVVDLPGQGPALIGQLMGNDVRTFSGDPFYVRREGDRLVRGETLELPGLINLYSFVPFADDKGQHYYAHLTKDDHLKVYTADGRDLWESEEYYGGSENCVANREETIGDMVVPVCLSARLLSPPGQGVLIVQNDGQRLMQRYRKFKQSRLLSMTWNGFAMVENWRTANQNGYLGDYTLADADNDGAKELVMAVKFQHKGVIDEARSSIVMFDME